MPRSAAPGALPRSAEDGPDGERKDSRKKSFKGGFIYPSDNFKQMADKRIFD
jgi:hypothetical protein